MMVLLEVVVDEFHHHLGHEVEVAIGRRS